MSLRLFFLHDTNSIYQLNDYNVKEYVMTQSLVFEFIDDPGDDSKDLRARRCRVKPNPDVSQQIWAQLVLDEAVVWRASYTCAKACLRIPEDLEEREPTLEYINLDELEGPSSPPKSPTSRKRKQAKAEDAQCPVLLHVSHYIIGSGA
jgi:hypothetical protein